MMNQTNLVIVPLYGLGANPVTATPVDVCDQCGGLFVRQGVMTSAMPHTH